MDLRTIKNGDYSWIIQIKEHFSHYVWLHRLRAKESKRVAKVMANWYVQWVPKDPFNATTEGSLRCFVGLL